MKLNRILPFIIVLFFVFMIPLSCEEAKHNIDFEHEGYLWIMPSDMHDSLLVKIEFAESTTEMMQGLMYRQEMNENEGMLFIYPYSQEMNFWMKNTHIPLDLIFIDETGAIVDLAEQTEAFSEKNISSKVLSKFVLEVNADYCKKNYVIIGDKVKWKRIEE